MAEREGPPSLVLPSIPSLKRVHKVLAGMLALGGLVSVAFGSLAADLVVDFLRPLAVNQSDDGVLTPEGVALMARAVRLMGAVGVLFFFGGFVAVLTLRPSLMDLTTGGKGGGQVRLPLSPWEGVVLAAALAVGLKLVWGWLGVSLWYDEAYTALHFVDPDRPFRAFTRFVGLNNHPLFSFLAALSVRLLGDSEWALRLPAVTAALVAPAVMAWIVRTRVGRGPAMVVLALGILSPVTVEMGVQARGYPLLLLATALSLLTLVRAWERPGVGRWLTWSSVVALGALVNVAFLVTLPVVVAAPLLGLRREGWPVVRARLAALTMALVVAGALAALAYATVLPQLVFELSSWSRRWQSASHLAGWMFFGYAAPAWGKTLALPMAAVLAVSLATRKAPHCDSGLRDVGLATIGFVVLLHFVVRGELRFFAALAPLVWLGAALAAGTLGEVRAPALARGGAAALLLSLLLGSGASLSATAQAPRTSLKEATAAVRSVAVPGACVILEWTLRDVVGYYAPELESVGDVGACPVGAATFVEVCVYCVTQGPPDSRLVAQISNRGGSAFRVMTWTRGAAAP